MNKKIFNPLLNLFRKHNSSSGRGMFKKEGLNLRDVVKNSYHPADEFNGYVKDKDLSNRNQQVYFNPESNKLLMSVAGTRSLGDIGTDFSLIGGNIKDTKRYRQADSTLKNAKQKYGVSADVVGHSLGSAITSRIAGADDRVFNYNSAEIGGKNRPNVHSVRHSGDIISVLGTSKSVNFGAPVEVANPFAWSSNHNSDRLGNNYFI